MALPAFAGARPAAVHRYLPPAARLLLLLWACDGTDRRTDRHSETDTVPLHCIDPATHTMWAAPRTITKVDYFNA